MIKAIMIGDSVLYGALGTGRLANHPQITLNQEQNVFDFCYNYAIPGSSWAGCFSDDPIVRLANGLPEGRTLAQTIDLHQDAGGVMFNLGGNDVGSSPDEVTALASRVKAAAGICQARGKLFIFIGVLEVNASSSYTYAPIGTDLYQSGYLTRAAALAGTAENLKQICRNEGYPYVDVRNSVPTGLIWNSITGDVVHPSQEYSTRIFRTVAKAIQGQ